MAAVVKSVIFSPHLCVPQALYTVRWHHFPSQSSFITQLLTDRTRKLCPHSWASDIPFQPYFLLIRSRNASCLRDWSTNRFLCLFFLCRHPSLPSDSIPPPAWLLCFLPALPLPQGLGSNGSVFSLSYLADPSCFHFVAFLCKISCRVPLEGTQMTYWSWSL